MKINVYKEGEEIVHPVTERVLKGGHILIGELEVRRVGLDYSIAVVSTLDPGKNIEVGDVVRVPGSIQIQISSEAPISLASTPTITTIGGGEERSFSERTKVDIETTFVSYREGAYFKDSLEFRYRFPSSSGVTMSITGGQDGYYLPTQGRYVWYGFGAGSMDYFLFDIEQSLMLGVAFSPAGIGVNIGVVIGEESGSNLELDLRGIIGFGFIGRGQLSIRALKDLALLSEVRFEDLAAVQIGEKLSSPVNARGVRLSLGAEYDVLENLALALQAGITNSVGTGNFETGFLGNLSTSIKF